MSEDRVLRGKCESKMDKLTEGQAVTQPVSQSITFHIIKQQSCCKFLGYRRSAFDVFIILGKSDVPLCEQCTTFCDNVVVSQLGS